jgi:Zn-dependent M28 family amino/carboxypeptidase
MLRRKRLNISLFYFIACTNFVFLLDSCSETNQDETAVMTEASTSLENSLDAILRKHVKELASDEYGGRAPATPGEELTIKYLVKEFKAAGLMPGNGESYLQEVPVTEIITGSEAVLQLRGSDYIRDVSYGDEMILSTYQERVVTEFNDSELVFVGYGINAPERNWNDYANIDVKGKTVVMLVNDPGFATGDPKLFNGKTMTWYGRWPYKFEEAARQGAAAAIIIHDTEPAAYGWDVVRNSWSGPQIKLTADDNGDNQSAAIGWITKKVAQDLFKGAGLDYEALVKEAAQPRFQAISMGDIHASATLRNNIRKSTSNNVVGVIPGSVRSDETLIYTAHWDHLGINTEVDGDNIWNGALDNASGTAALLALSNLYSRAAVPPERTIVFLAVTAEESGLLGSQWYAQHPLFDPALSVANINMDGLNVIGPMNDVVVVGFGNSELEDYLAAAVAQQPGRYVAEEPHPERGYYYRSDHLNFARIGVPALYAESGEDSREHGREWGTTRAQEYTDLRYHTPADEYDENWDLRGAIEDIELYYNIGSRLASSSDWPNWYEGNEFKATRDATAKRRTDH